MIDKAKQGAIINSAYGYLDAIEKFYITNLAENPEFELDGSYTIENGNLEKYEIPFSGNVPISGRITYKNNDFINGIIQYDDYYVLIYGGKTKVINVPKNNSDGLYASTLEMDKGRYLYKGANPNNYIWLDENGDNKTQESELYRIISYEVDGTIKVVRNNSIGEYAWDIAAHRFNSENTYCIDGVHGCNAWGNVSDTNFYYNTNSKYQNYFYTSANSDEISGGGYGTVSISSSLNTFLNGEWINNLKNTEIIDNHIFSVNGIYPLNKGLEKEKKEQYFNKWYGKIGLMNITDMVESSLNSECVSVYSNFQGNPNRKGTPCTVNNFLYKANDEWFITPYSDYYPQTLSMINVFTIENKIFVHRNAVRNFNIRPTFFLRSDLTLIGEGTKQNPYNIKKINT